MLRNLLRFTSVAHHRNSSRAYSLPVRLIGRPCRVDEDPRCSTLRSATCRICGRSSRGRLSRARILARVL
jgi:hypothetical protein